MSYTDYNTDAVSEKIVLVEIDELEDWTLFFNTEPGIWAIRYSVDLGNATYNFGAGAFGFGAFGTAGVADLSNGLLTSRINSLYAGDEWYSKVTSLADLRTTDKSFYFDGITLYVHFENHDPPDSFDDIELGISLGYANKMCYYDDVFYDARLLSVPSITRSKDPLFFGKISFEGGTITLENSDGNFDNFQDSHDIYGAAVRILLGFEDNAYTDFKTLYEGYIDNVRTSETVFEIEARDKRKALSRKIPTSVFDTTTYPNLNSANANKPIPLVYGACDNIPVICTNEEESSPSSWSFKVCDVTNRSIKAIDAVRVNGVATSAATVDLSAGTFTLAADDFESGKMVTADVQGYVSGASLISNGLEILRDILSNHFSKTYGSTFYNTTAWASAESAAADIAIFINEPMEGWKVIEDISFSLHGNFIVQDDGKFTFRTYDSTRALDQTIYYWELLDQLLEVDDRMDEVLSSCRIGYDKNWDEDTYTELIYDDDEATIADTFKFYRERTFDTLLTASGSATTFAESIMAIADGVRPIFRARTKMQSIDREISDMVRVEYKPKNRDFIGWMTAEVIGKTVNLDDMVIDLTLRKT